MKKEKNELEKKIKKLELEIIQEDIERKTIYKNAFEWRLEFPEVLDDEGNFKGFDVVIGNPPYMRIQEIERTQGSLKKFYERRFKNAQGSYELANLFFELTINISKSTSNNSLIFPHKFLNSDNAKPFREYLIKEKYVKKIAHFGANMVFEDADTYTCVISYNKVKSSGIYFYRFPFKSEFKKLLFENEIYSFIEYQKIINASFLYGKNNWILFNNPEEYDVVTKIYTDSKKFEDVFIDIFQGIATRKDEIYVLDLLNEYENKYVARVPKTENIYDVEKDLVKKFVVGKEVQRYSILEPNKIVFVPYLIKNDSYEIINLDIIKNSYPVTYQYLKDHEEEFKKRENSRASKMDNWYAYIYPKNLNKFEQPKLSSMEICSNFTNVTFN
jgi:hypothetical protein